MITTESEAKTKWCPLVRVRGSTRPGSPVGYNRTVYSTKENLQDWLYVRILPGPIYRYWAGVKYFRCQGCKCMSWRWVDRERGFCGEFGAPDAGALAQNPRLMHRAEPVPPRSDGSTMENVVLIVGTAISAAVIVYAARKVGMF